MAEVKQKDFVELEYTGKIKNSGEIFDTTDKKIAEDNDVLQEEHEYKPIIVCVGENQIIKGLDNALAGKEKGKSYTIEVKAEDAYGKKDAKMIQLIPTNKFIKENIQPMPGLQVNIDGMLGFVKTVSGGRTMVDFNHPLSSKDLTYEIKISRIIEDDKEKISSYFDIMNAKDIEVSIENSKAEVKIKQEMPKEIKEPIEKKLKELIPSLQSVTISKLEKK